MAENVRCLYRFSTCNFLLVFNNTICKALSNLHFIRHLLSTKLNKIIIIAFWIKLNCYIKPIRRYHFVFFTARTKAICPRHITKKKYIYEQEFISQRNCDVLRIISDILAAFVTKLLPCEYCLRVWPRKFLSIRGRKTSMVWWIKSLDQDGTNIKFRRNLAL